MKRNKAADVFQKINMHDGDTSVCWEGMGCTIDKGRPYIFVNGRKWLAYRLVYNLCNEVPVKDDEVIRHTCDNGEAPIACCNPAHLKKGSHSDNMMDLNKSSRHGMPKTVVKHIKKLISEGRTHKSIAELYGCSRENITSINNDRSYAYLGTDKYENWNREEDK